MIFCHNGIFSFHFHVIDSTSSSSLIFNGFSVLGFPEAFSSSAMCVGTAVLGESKPKQEGSCNLNQNITKCVTRVTLSS